MACLARLAPIAALMAVVGTGCSVFKSNDDAQVIVNARVIGMPAGDFFQTFGRWRTRSELPGGSFTYAWESGGGATPAGVNGLDERVCRMRVVSTAAGRIGSATIEFDNPGRVSTSRCTEIFKPKLVGD